MTNKRVQITKKISVEFRNDETYTFTSSKKQPSVILYEDLSPLVYQTKSFYLTKSQLEKIYKELKKYLKRK